MSITHKAVLRLKKEALVDIVNVWVEKNFIPGTAAVSVDASSDGDQFQIMLETKSEEKIQP
jgi:hypothetical protein